MTQYIQGIIQGLIRTGGIYACRKPFPDILLLLYFHISKGRQIFVGNLD